MRGGAGFASLVLAVKRLPLEHLTAVVTVTDDGGATGTVRYDRGQLAPAVAEPQKGLT